MEPPAPRWSMRLIRDPMLHFVAIGAIVFGIHALLRDRSRPGAEDEIAVTAALRASLVRQFETRTGRTPTPDEARALIDAAVEREVLYREALALGLDRGDPIIRRRLIQRMELLAEDLARANADADRDKDKDKDKDADEPADEQLVAYLADRADDYRAPPRVLFEHVFWRDGGDDGGERRREIGSALAALRAGTAPDGLGEPFAHGAAIAGASPQRVAALMGEEFAGALADVPEGVWTGPIESAYGLHLVRVTERTPARLPAVSEIRSRLRADWRRERLSAATRAVIDEMRGRYRVVIQGADGEDGARSAAQETR